MPRLTFKKQERLNSKKILEELFQSAAYFHIQPLKIIHKAITTPVVSSPLQLAISVPKRNFKRAVHRNKIKRRIREAFRKQKHILYERLKEKKIAVMLVYTAKTIKPYRELEKTIPLIIKRLTKHYE